MSGKDRTHRLTLLSLIIIVPVGFAVKFYSGPGSSWANNSLAGVFYEIFWCLVVFFIRPRTRPVTIAALVFIITCALEFLQLWHPPFLQALRATFLGRAVLGTTFVWADFPYYVIGSAVGWAWLCWIRQRALKDCYMNPR